MDRRRWRTERRSTAAPLTKGRPTIKNNEPAFNDDDDDDDDNSHEEMPGAYAITRRQSMVPEEMQSTLQENIDRGDLLEGERQQEQHIARDDEQEQIRSTSQETIYWGNLLDGGRQQEQNIARNLPLEIAGAEHSRRRHQNMKRVVICIVGIYVTLSLILGVVFGIKAGERRGRDDVASAAERKEIDEIKRIQHEECLINDQYISIHLSTLQPLVLHNAAPFTVEAIDTPGSYQRAALCWLSEVDEFFEMTDFMDESTMVSSKDVIQMNERFSLASMFYHWVPFGSTQIAGISTLNWLSSIHICKWDFVACAGGVDNRVTGLSLVKMNLNSFIPRELSQLSALVDLRLGGSGLTGTIPSELSLLRRLQLLDLVTNDILGSIPLEFAKLTQLRILDVSNNLLSGDIPSELFGLPEIEFLHLGANRLNGTLPSQMGDATSLKQILIHFNFVSGTVPSLSGLTSLEAFEIKRNPVSGSFPDLTGCKRLEHVSFESLELKGTLPESLGTLTELKHFQLHRSGLSGTVPTEIGLLTGLENLVLSGNSFSGSIPSTIGMLAQLTILDLHEMVFLTGTLPAEMGNLSQLTKLLLPNRMSGSVPESVCSLLLGDLEHLQGPSPACQCCTSNIAEIECIQSPC